MDVCRAFEDVALTCKYHVPAKGTQARLRACRYVRLDGSTNRVQRMIDINRFNRPGSDLFIYILNTRAGESNDMHLDPCVHHINCRAGLELLDGSWMWRAIAVQV